MNPNVKIHLHLLWRIAIVLFGGFFIWWLMLQLSDWWSGEDDLQSVHFFTALFVSVMTVLLLLVVRRYVDRIPWEGWQALWGRIKWRTILLGMFCWIVPAGIGVTISIAMGWVSLSMETSISEVFWMALFLLVAVFLMEAFPEELIFRGYIYKRLNKVYAHWLTLILQAMLFTLFAWMVGALYSMEQIMFIPGFAVLLGYFRTLTRDIWFPMGFHLALMMTTQLISPVHDQFNVEGSFFALQFFSFILLPSAVSSAILMMKYGQPDWDARLPKS